MSAMALVYFWGVAVHLVGVWAYNSHQKKTKRESETDQVTVAIGQAIHIIGWPVITPSFFVYSWLKRVY
jgi:hypothetical protein